jgi:GAF domain-containing protein
VLEQELLVRTLVDLTDTLCDEFDVLDLWTLLVDRCVEVLDVSAAGVMLVTPEGSLRIVASSSEAMRLVELFELQADEGPCVDCYRSGEAVLNEGLEAAKERWPAFTSVALGSGFRRAQAVPMRLRGEVLGALNLLQDDDHDLDASNVLVARAFADVATIALIQHRALSDAQALTEQLQHALNSRVLIEQAKGMVAEGAGVDLDRAFSLLRTYARNRNLQLRQVALDVTSGTLAPGALG